jgi:hypothetical protein
MLAVVLLVVGLCGSWAVATVLRQAESRRLSDGMGLRVQAVSSAVAGETQRYVDTVGTLATAVGAQPDLTAPGFRAVTADLRRSHLAGAVGVALVVPVSNDEVPRAQRYWRARGSPRLVLHPSPGVFEHRFGVLTRRLDDSRDDIVSAPAGQDLAAMDELAEAMEVARASGEVAASRTYAVGRDPVPSDSERLYAFTMTAPVYGPAGSHAAAAFRGWLVLSMRGLDFLTETVRQVAHAAVNITLYELSDGRSVQVARLVTGPALARPGLVRDLAVTVGQRHWTLHLQPTVLMLPVGGKHLSELAFAGCVLISALLAGLVLSLVLSHDRAVARVEETTLAQRQDAEYRRQLEDALRQARDEIAARDAALGTMLAQAGTRETATRAR